MATTEIIMKATIKVSSLMKSINEKPAAEPMIIFGGSPINVAVPPIFEQKISVIKKGIGLISNFLAIEKVIGIIKITVVTLSKKALTTAVKTPNTTITLMGWPFVIFKKLFAI